MFLRTTLLTTNLIKNSILLNNETLKVNQLLILGKKRNSLIKIAREDKKPSLLTFGIYFLTYLQ